jgi:hypothetical protein
MDGGDDDEDRLLLFIVGDGVVVLTNGLEGKGVCLGVLFLIFFFCAILG